MAEYIDRQAIIEKIRYQGIYGSGYSDEEREDDVVDMIESIPAADVRPVPEGGIGEMSDGYHTFNGLYYQRMVLFAALVKAHKDRAWKSLRHEDGELCFGGGWFIVGIDTPEGSYTYHYEDKYWNWFECEELPAAKHWDGHTEADVTRLLSLPNVRPVVHSFWGYNPGDNIPYCDNCGMPQDAQSDFCHFCGADMRPTADAIKELSHDYEKLTGRGDE